MICYKKNCNPYFERERDTKIKLKRMRVGYLGLHALLMITPRRKNNNAYTRQNISGLLF